MHCDVSPVLAQTFTEPFIVYSAKRFPGVPGASCPCAFRVASDARGLYCARRYHRPIDCIGQSRTEAPTRKSILRYLRFLSSSVVAHEVRVRRSETETISKAGESVRTTSPGMSTSPSNAVHVVET